MDKTIEINEINQRLDRDTRKTEGHFRPGRAK